MSAEPTPGAREFSADQAPGLTRLRWRQPIARVASVRTTPRPTHDADRFQLDLLEPRLLLAADGLAPLLKPVLFDAHAADRPRDTVALDERIETHDSARLEWQAPAGEESLFGAAEETAPPPPSTAAPQPSELSAMPAVATATASAAEAALTPSDANVVSVPLDEPAPVLPLVLKRFASGEFEPGLPVGPPAEREPLMSLETAEEAESYDLTTLISDALAALKAHVAAWTALYNLASIDWASHGGTVLKLPVMPDALSDLFKLADQLDALDFPTLVADSKEALVTELQSLGFTVTAIEGGLGSGENAIPATTEPGVRILVSYSVVLATNIAVAPDYTGETFDKDSERLLDGVGSNLNPTGDLGLEGKLSLELHFGVDDDGFFIAGDSGLVLHVTADGTFAGTADVLGASGSTITIAAKVDVEVALGFVDPAARYRLDADPTNLNTLMIATASGTAQAVLTFTRGPTVLHFTADYTLTVEGTTVNQAVALTLTGTLELPGFTFSASGAAAVLNLTGEYTNTNGTATWTLTAATADLKAFGFEVKSAMFTVTGTASAFSGSGTAAMEIDFLTHSSQPATFNLAAAFDAETLTLDATLSFVDLVFGNNGGQAFLTTGRADLELSLTGNFGAGTLAGTIGLNLYSATLSQGGSTYSATFRDGADDDEFALTGTFDFGAQSLTLNADTFELLVTNAIKVTALGALVTYSRSSSSTDQDLLTLGEIDVELLAFANAGTTETPIFRATGVIVRESGFSIANGTLTMGDLTIGNILRLDAPTVTLNQLSYASGALAGTIAVTTAGATVLPGISQFTATLSDGDGDGIALTGAFAIQSRTFSLELDTFALTVPNVFAAHGAGATLTYDALETNPQQLFELETLQVEFLTLKVGTQNLTASLTRLTVYTDGFTAANVSLPAEGAALGVVRIGTFLELTNPTVQLVNVSYTEGTGFGGSLRIAAEQVVLFPGVTAFTTTFSDSADDADAFALDGTVNLASGAFSLTVDAFAMNVPNVFGAHGGPVTIHYDPAVSGQQELFALESFTMEFLSLQTAGGANLTASVSRLSIFTDGFAVESISLPAVAQPALGAVRVGSFLELTNPALQLTGLSYTTADGLAGQIQLTAEHAVFFPGSTFTATLSDGADENTFAISGSIALSSGKFALNIDQLLLVVGQAVRITGQGIDFNYDPTAPPGPQELVSIDELDVTSPLFDSFGTVKLTTFKLRTDGFSFSNLSLTQTSAEARIGDFLAVSGAVISATTFNVTFGGTTAVTGVIALTASSIKLFPDGGLVTSTVADFSASFVFRDGGAGKLKIVAGTFGLQVGEALAISASNVVLTPSDDPILTIQQALVTSPVLQSFGSAVVQNLVVGPHGFSVENLILAQPAGQTTTIGGFLSFTGAQLVVAGAAVGDSFTVHYGGAVEGTVTLTATSIQLFPNGGVIRSELTDFVASFDFANAGQLTLEFSSFSFAIGEALLLTATNHVTITPGQVQLATIALLDVTSPMFSQLSFQVEAFTLFQHGFSLAAATFTLGDIATPVISFAGAVLKLAGVDASSPFSVNYGLGGTTISGTIELTVASMKLFPTVTFLTTDVQGLQVSYDFADLGRLRVSLSSFALQIGEALRLVAGSVDLHPGSLTVGTIGSITVNSPQFGLGAGSFTIADFVIRQNGFHLGTGTLQIPSVALGAVTLDGVVLTATDFDLTIDGGVEIGGTLTLAIDSIALFPNGGYLTSSLTAISASYDFEGGTGSLRIIVGDFELHVGEALAISAHNVELAPGAADVIARIATATITAPSFTAFGSANVTDLEISHTGFSLASLTLAQADGAPVTIGNFLSFSGLQIHVEGVDAQSKFTVVAGSAPSGRVRIEATSVALFPNGGVITSDLQGFSAQYDFDHGGALTISFTRFALAIGEALLLVASDNDGNDAPVTISPRAAVLVSIPQLTVSSPLIAGLAPFTLTNLQVKPDGFSFTSATLGQAPGTTARIGSFVEFEGVTVAASGPAGGGDFAVSYGEGGVTITGEITFTAARLTLFPNATFLTTAVTGFVGTYDFAPGGTGSLRLSLETLQLDIGEALRLTAGVVGVPNGIVITPGEETILQLNELTVTSPLITSGLNSVTLQNFTATRDGFAFDVFTLSQVPAATATIGTFLSFTGLAITVNSFAYSETHGVSGAVLFSAASIALFPGSTTITSTLSGISGSFDFSAAGSLRIDVHAFELLVGDAVRLDATSVTLTPGAPSVLATITTATANSPRLAGLPAVDVTNLTVRRDGFSFTALTITQPAGVVSNFGTFLSFSGVVLTVAGPQGGGDFDLTFGAGGTTTLAGSISLHVDSLTLFPDATFLTSSFTGVNGSFDFAGGAGSMIIAIDSFTLAVGEAFKLSASGADAQNPILIRPGQNILLSVPSATVTSNLVTGLGEISVANFQITRTGFSVGTLTLTQAEGVTASIGSVLSFSGAALTLNNFALERTGAGNWDVQGSVTLAVATMKLFPTATFLTSTFTGVQASFAFNQTGSLALHFDTMVLRIGTALEISSTAGGDFTPGQQTILTLGNLHVTAPGIQGMGTGTITQLVVRQNGLSIGSLTIGQAEGQTAQFGSFLSMTGAQLTVNNFSLINNDGAISVSGGILFTAASLDLFPGSTGFTTSLTSFTGSYQFGPGGSGDLEITIGTFQLKVGTALEVNASGVKLHPGKTTLAEITDATIKAPGFAQLPEIALSGLTITTTGFHINAFTITQGAGAVTFGSVLAFEGLAVSATGVNYVFGGALSLDAIVVTATRAAVFPGNSTFSATVVGFTGSYASGALELTAAQFTFQFGTSLKVTATSLLFAPESTTLIAHADTIEAALPSLGVTGTGTGLDIKPGGTFSIVWVSLNTAGLAQAIGLGSLLPFNITSLELKFHGDTNGNGQQDGDEVLELTKFDLTVTGTFDFSKMSGLPFTPIVQIGPQDSAQTFNNATDTFTFTIEVIDGAIRPKDIGPITLGFSDLKVGSTVKMEGWIRLGGYADGQWVSSFGGHIGVVDSDAMSGVTGAAVTMIGSYDGNAGRLVAFANLTISFQYGDAIKVTNAGLGFNLIVSSASGGGISLDQLQLTSASVESITLNVGSYLSMAATNVALNFNPAPGDYIASFGSMSARVKAGGFDVTGTARHFAIDASGKLAALPGFGVSLTINDSASIKWPTWLPIQITSAAIAWADFNVHPEAFSLTISATVTSLNGLSAFKVQGAVNGLVIDLGMLEQGKFPITRIGSMGVTVSGDAFGGKIEGTLVLGIVLLKGGVQLPSDSTETPDDRVLYGAIQAGFSFAGASGFSIRIGLSSLGPLQLYMEASIPVLLDPNTGLSITDFRAGVRFGVEIPEPANARALAGADYQPADKVTLEDWIAQLEAQIVNLADSGASWAHFGEKMTFQAGATLFSAYLSPLSFRAEIDFIFDTSGKFIIDAAMVYGDTLSQTASLYFDLAKLADGSGRILFLSREPGDPTLPTIVTIYGELTFGFARADGTEVTPTNQADRFQIILSGGVEFQALSFASLTIEGTVRMEFGTTRFDLYVVGRMDISYVGDALAMSGALHIERDGGDVNVWGALLITTPALGKLEQLGVFANGTFVVRLNFTDHAYTETLTLPNGTQFNVDLPKQSFSVLVEGYLIFRLEGQEWFRVVGSFGMEVNAHGLTVFGVGDLLVGPAASPWLTFSFDGIFSISDIGVGGLLDLALKTNFPESTGITLSGTYLLEFNTSGQTIEYTLPASVVTIPGGGENRTLTIAAAAPVAGSTPGPYLVVSGQMNLGVLGLVFVGHFDFIVTTALLRIEASATLSLEVLGAQLFLFNVGGGFQVDGKGIVAAFTLTRNMGVAPGGFSFGLDTTYTLELNTTNAPATIGTTDLQAGRYARISIHGDLAIAGSVISGDFKLTVGENLLKLEADASLVIAFGPIPLFSFGVSGGFQIDNHGIAAVLVLQLHGGEDEPTAPPAFKFTADFTLQVNTTGRAVQIATTLLEAGSYLRISADGTLEISGFTVEGNFMLTVAPTYVRMEANAAMLIEIGHVTVFHFGVTGDLQLNDAGLAAVLELTVATGPPTQLGFSFSASFEFRLNTTLEDVAFTTVTVKAGEVYVHAQGDLKVAGLTLAGTFEMGYSGGEFHVQATATLDLKVGSTRLLGFTANGLLSINEQGLAAAFTISLQSGASFPSGYGIAMAVSFQLQINTRPVGVTIVNVVDGTPVATTLTAGPYAWVQLEGALTIFGFKFTGKFYVSVGVGQFTLGGAAKFDLFNTAGIDVLFDFGLFADGMAGRVVLAINELGVANLFALRGAFGVEFNTTHRTVFEIAPQTGRVYIKHGELTVLKLTMRGTVYIGVSNGRFEIVIPSSDPLTLDFFGIVSVQVSGFVRQDGQFSITGSVALALGARSLVSIEGHMTVSIANSGVSASINGSLWVFNQSVATLSGYVAVNDSGFRVVATVTFKLPSPFTAISLSGKLDLTISSAGIKGSISASVSLWGLLNGSVGAYFDSGTGSWFVSGSAGFSVGNGDIGARGSINLGIGYLSQGMVLFGWGRSAGWHTSLYLDGSAWAGIKIAGHHIGISGGLSASIDVANAHASVTIHGSVVGIKFSKTITVDFRNGIRVHLSDVAGSIVFLDLNRNGRWDPGEPTTTADGNGYFHFSDEDSLSPGTATPPTPFAQLDANGNGFIDDDEGVFYVVGGTRISDGTTGGAPEMLAHNLVAGRTDFAGATLFIDTNGNGTLDPGEYSVTTGEDGSYDFYDVLFPTETFDPNDASHALGSLAIYDTNRNGILDPEEGQLYVLGGFDSNTGAVNNGAALIGNDHLSGYAPFHSFERVFFDVNGNGAYDPGEPSFEHNGTSFYSFNGFSSPTNALGRLAPYDLNGNGRIDPEEGIFYIFGGQDLNSGAANEQTIAIQGDGAGGGIRRVASPLAHLVDLLQLRDTNGNDAHLILSAAFGMPYYIDFETFDPAVSEALNPDPGFHHEVEGVSAQLAALLLNGSDALVGAANGNLSAETAQNAIIQALVDRLVHIVPDEMPPVDAEGNLIAKAALLDLTDPNVVHEILQAAAALLQITFTEEPAPETSPFTFHLVSGARAVSAVGSEFLFQGARVTMNSAGGIQLVLPDAVSRVAATVIGVQNGHIDELVDHRVTNITEALARVKFVAQHQSSDRLGLLALGHGSAADILHEFGYDNLLTTIDQLVIPYGNLPPGVAIVGEVTLVDGGVFRLPFTVTDPDALPVGLLFTVTSSDGRVVAPGDVTVEGTGYNRELVIRPTSTFHGTTTLTLTVSDGAIYNSTHSVTIVVTVLPDLTVTNVQQTYNAEGRQVIRFTVELSGPSNSPIDLLFATLDGTAQAGSDFVATSGRLVIAPGATTATIDVIVLSDFYRVQGPESFTLRLTIESGAHFAHREFEGTIIDRDVPLSILVPTGAQRAAAWSFLPPAMQTTADALLPEEATHPVGSATLGAFSFSSLSAAVQLEQLAQVRTIPTL